MGLPKTRKSKARTHGQRKINMKMTLPIMTKCPECGELTPSHKVCIHCGYYKGKLVKEVEKD